MFDWISQILQGGGVWAIAALMFLENVFPPIPSELIMPLAGYNAAQGGASLWATILSGTLGSVAGTWLWYLAGRVIGAERLRKLVTRHGRWLTLTPRQLDQAQGWFDRHGAAVVFFGRFVPTVRTLISVPAGLAAMPLPRFLLFTMLGSLIWCSLLSLAGWWLRDQYDLVGAWLNPVSTIIVVGLGLAYLWRVIRWQPEG